MKQYLKDLDAEKLFAIAWRICSDETVDETQELALLIKRAAELVIKAGQRILGIETRAIDDPDADLVGRIVEEYRK